MAARREGLASDSTELLLDTICNVFGGIILMAILVVLLTQSSAGRIPDPTSEEVDRALEAQRLRFEIGRLRRRLADLEEHRAEIERTFLATTSPTGERLTGAVHEFRKAIIEAKQRVVASQKALTHARRDQVEAERELRATTTRIDEKREEFRRLEARLESAQTSRRKDVRLPHRSGSGRGTPRYYVVKGGNVYRFGQGPLPRWEGGPYRVEDCMVSPLGGMTGAEVRPVEGAGMRVPKEQRGLSPFLATLDRCHPRTHYIFFFVYPDSESFASFQRLKEIAVGRRFSYALTPVAPGADYITIVPTSYHETE